MTVILLAAGVGKRFGKRTKRLPKCLIPIGKNSCLLSRYLDSFQKLGLQKIVIVVGHEKEKIKAHCRKIAKNLSIFFVTNPDFKRGSIVSLYSARKYFNDDILVMDADVYFPTQALQSLINYKFKSVFLADTRVKSTGEEMMLMSHQNRLHAIAKRLEDGLKPVAEATGIVKFSKKDAALLLKILRKFIQNKILDVEYEESYSELLKKRKIQLLPIKGFWTEMDFEADRQKILRYG